MQTPRKNPIRLIVATAFLVVLLIGIGLGLLLGQFVLPQNRNGAGIANLSSVEKEKFVVLVGAAYSQDHDLARAKEQLDQLGFPNAKQWVSELAERYIADEMPSADVQALAQLAHGLGATDRGLMAFMPSPTPSDTQTPTLTPTPTPTPTATDTSTPAATDTSTPTATASPIPPTDTAIPTPTRSATPEPSDTPRPPTKTPRPQPTNTRRPPSPTNTPAPQWSYTARLIGPIDQTTQNCTEGLLQVRVTVLNAAGAQVPPGTWIYDDYTKQYQVTGNVGDPGWGSGETRFIYYRWGGGRLCVAQGQGGNCVSDYTRNLPCSNLPPVEDLYAAGYCDLCCDRGISLEGCRQRIAEGTCFETGEGHFSWHVVFRRGW